ncbi:hypothetical protein BGZ94_009421 [Podila epigama]|nr:hypothetical protein BGZ94_009421 [Podila epigama]
MSAPYGTGYSHYTVPVDMHEPQRPPRKMRPAPPPPAPEGYISLNSALPGRHAHNPPEAPKPAPKYESDGDASPIDPNVPRVYDHEKLVKSLGDNYSSSNASYHDHPFRAAEEDDEDDYKNVIYHPPDIDLLHKQQQQLMHQQQQLQQQKQYQYQQQQQQPQHYFSSPVQSSEKQSQLYNNQYQHSPPSTNQPYAYTQPIAAPTSAGRPTHPSTAHSYQSSSHSPPPQYGQQPPLSTSFGSQIYQAHPTAYPPSHASTSPPSVSSHYAPSHRYSLQGSIPPPTLQQNVSTHSLTNSINSAGNPSHGRRDSGGSTMSALQRQFGSVQLTSPRIDTSGLDPKTAETLLSLPVEDIPRTYLIAPLPNAPSGSSSIGPFRIVAVCEALNMRDKKEGILHISSHVGYSVSSNVDNLVQTHGTVFQHLATTTMFLASGFKSDLAKPMMRLAEKVMKVVQQTIRLPGARDSIGETGVEPCSLVIEKAMTEYVHMGNLTKLLRDVTGATSQTVDWSGGLQKINMPNSGRPLWCCQRCYVSFKSGNPPLGEHQPTLDDLVDYPEKSGVKSEARLDNPTTVEVYTQLIKNQNKMKQVVLNLSPEFFERPENKVATIFQANQTLFKNLARALADAQLTMVEIDGHQLRGASELMDNDNIYLHLRQIFACVSLTFVKFSNLPFLFREKLPGYLRVAKFLLFDGVLIDNDKAVTNMKKLIAENADMLHLVITNGHLTGSGLKVLCSSPKVFRRLTKLDLSKNKIDAEGIKELATSMLPLALDLRTLDLSENPNIGFAGCQVLVNTIWPGPSYNTTEKHLTTLNLANTGFTDEAVANITRAIEKSDGALAVVNLNGHRLSKPALVGLLTVLTKNSNTGTLRRISLSPAPDPRDPPGFLDYEFTQMLTTHLMLTHITVSKFSLAMVAQVVVTNKVLVSLTVDDAVCPSTDPNHERYLLSSFGALCQAISANRHLGELKLKSAWSFWTIVFPPRMPDETSAWESASSWMAMMETCLIQNTTLRSFHLRGVTNFEDEVANGRGGGGAASVHGSVGSTGTTSPSERKMNEYSQRIRGLLERNQLAYYASKLGVDNQLQKMTSFSKAFLN